MLAVRLPEKLEQRLSELAEQTHRSKSYYVKQAILIHLYERIF
ncbi:TraY domain-containing protein [Legionella sp. CNM-1927-20]